MSRASLSIDPHVVSGAVCIDGTRMWIHPAYKMVADPQYRSGTWTDERLLAYLESQWPAYTREAVLLCCWYAARHGKKKYRKAWKGWLRANLWEDPDGKLPPPIEQTPRERSDR